MQYLDDTKQQVPRPAILQEVASFNWIFQKRIAVFILSNFKISIWTLLFYKKNVRKKAIFFKISKVLYFLLGGCTDAVCHMLETYKCSF